MTDPKPAKAPAAKTTVAKAGLAKTPVRKTPAAKPPVAPVVSPVTPIESVVTPVAVTPVVVAPVIAPAAATAPAGWYQVDAALPQQRYWDGTAWTEYFHDPAAVTAPVAATGVRAPGLKAPDGTNPTTVWFWITAASPALAIVGFIPTAIYLGNAVSTVTDPSQLAAQQFSVAGILTTLTGFVALAAYILFPILDSRQLVKRGVPSPFHWAWSLAALIVSSPIVYVIGRTVVVKRRTGSGLAPLWLFIALQLIAWIVGLIVAIAFIAAVLNQFEALLSTSGGDY